MRPHKVLLNNVAERSTYKGPVESLCAPWGMPGFGVIAGNLREERAAGGFPQTCWKVGRLKSRKRAVGDKVGLESWRGGSLSTAFRDLGGGGGDNWWRYGPVELWPWGQRLRLETCGGTVCLFWRKHSFNWVTCFSWQFNRWWHCLSPGIPLVRHITFWSISESNCLFRQKVRCYL